ncbi:MAG: hypothetical protein V9E94_14840 [Microthrixaceae bacterium]
MSESAARSLDLLRAIESTLDGLDHLADRLHADTAFAEKAFAGLDRAGGAIDADEKLQGALEFAQGKVAELHHVLVGKRQHARDDCQLREEDGIEAAYCRAIAAAADLHNAINALRWNIGEHDIDAQPAGLSKRYSVAEIDNLFDDLAA